MALILLYITYFSDFAGRQLTLIPKRLVWNQPTELIAASIRFLFVPGTINSATCPPRFTDKILQPSHGDLHCYGLLPQRLGVLCIYRRVRRYGWLH